MNIQTTAILILAYGILLILGSIIYFSSINFLLVFEPLFYFVIGVFALGVSYFIFKHHGWAFWSGMAICLIMTIFEIFQLTFVLYHFIDMLQNDPIGNPYDEGLHVFLTFTILLLSLIIGIFQIALAKANSIELKTNTEKVITQF